MFQPQLRVKTEYLPTRCEICHQKDKFNPEKNHCTRCNDFYPKEKLTPIVRRNSRSPIFTFIEFLGKLAIFLFAEFAVFICTLIGMLIAIAILIVIYEVIISLIGFKIIDYIFGLLFGFIVLGFILLGLLASGKLVQDIFLIDDINNAANNFQIDENPSQIIGLEEGPYWLNNRNPEA
ncbi:MAG: hypothetical protein HY819_05470 [Acidobacteria bacterium]|nr:hypothetical protein [Acidobacteriota bacterium]